MTLPKPVRCPAGKKVKKQDSAAFSRQKQEFGLVADVSWLFRSDEALTCVEQTHFFVSLFASRYWDGSVPETTDEITSAVLFDVTEQLVFIRLQTPPPPILHLLLRSERLLLMGFCFQLIPAVVLTDAGFWQKLNGEKPVREIYFSSLFALNWNLTEYIFNDGVVNNILERLMIIFYTGGEREILYSPQIVTAVVECSVKEYMLVYILQMYLLLHILIVFLLLNLIFCVKFTFLFCFFLFFFLNWPFVFCFPIFCFWEVLLPPVVKQVVASK